MQSTVPHALWVLGGACAAVVLGCAPSPPSSGPLLAAQDTPEPSCPVAAVPPDAGAVLEDSTTFEQPELGTKYRYAHPAFSYADVYLYPRAGHPTPVRQAAGFAQVTVLYGRQGRFDPVEFVREDESLIQVDARGEQVTFEGHEAVMRIGIDGVEHETFFAVYPHRDSFVKFRVTHEPTEEARQAITRLVEGVLSDLAGRPEGCRP